MVLGLGVFLGCQQPWGQGCPETPGRGQARGRRGKAAYKER